MAFSYSSPVSSPQSASVSAHDPAAIVCSYLTNDGSIVQRLVAALGLQVLNLAYDALSIDNLAVNDVLVVEMGCRDGSDEELRAIGACLELAMIAYSYFKISLTRSCVCHAQ